MELDQRRIRDEQVKMMEDSGNFLLRSDFPCIDAGSNAAIPAGITTDLDGLPRIIRGKPLHMTLPRPGQPVPLLLCRLST